jgi:membrane-associated protease RseP (regulator of RpoE activity)
MLDLLIFLAAIGVLWLVVGLSYRRYKLKKRGVILYPGAIMWRTTKGLGVIDRTATKHRRFWNSYGNVAVAVGLFFMIFVFVNIILNIIFLLMQPANAPPGATFVLPGLIPGLGITAWLISVGVVLVIHEFSHGLLLRSQGLKTRSTGAMIFLFIPGAFVEPDEKELKKAPITKRMRMFAAGPVSNIVFAFIFLFILLAFLVPKQGVYVYAVAKNYPLENYVRDNMFGHITDNNLKSSLVENYVAENLLGARILTLNSATIGTMTIDSIDNFDNFMSQTKPGDNVTMVIDNGTDNKTFTLTLTKDSDNENMGAIGIAAVSAPPHSAFLNPLLVLGSAFGVFLGAPYFSPLIYNAVVPWAVIDILKWLFVLNLGVGMFNLLPAKPLDGGYLFEGLLEKRISKESARKVVKVCSYLVLILIIMNFIPAVLRRL